MKQASRVVPARLHPRGQKHSLDNYLLRATNNLSPQGCPKKSVDANKTHDSHSLMLPARMHKEQQPCLSLGYFLHPNIWTLQSQRGERGRLTVSQTAPLRQGFQLFVLQRGMGSGQGDCVLGWWCRKKAALRGLERRDPSISCHGCLRELLL